MTSDTTLRHLIHQAATLPPAADEQAEVERNRLAAARLDMIAVATRGDDTSPRLLRHRADALREVLELNPVTYAVKEQP